MLPSPKREKEETKHIRPTMLLSNQEYKTQSGFNYVAAIGKQTIIQFLPHISSHS